MNSSALPVPKWDSENLPSYSEPSLPTAHPEPTTGTLCALPLFKFASLPFVVVEQNPHVRIANPHLPGNLKLRQPFLTQTVSLLFEVRPASFLVGHKLVEETFFLLLL